MKKCLKKLIPVFLLVASITVVYFNDSPSQPSQQLIKTEGKTASSIFDLHINDVIVLLHIPGTGMTSLSKSLVSDLDTDTPCACPESKTRCVCTNREGYPWLFQSYNTTGYVCGEHADWTTLMQCPIDRWMENVGHDSRQSRRYWMLTLLREPVARFVQEWQQLVTKDAYFLNEPRLFRQESPELQKKKLPCLVGKKIASLSLNDFLECPENPALNRMTRMLANVTEVDTLGYDGKEYNTALLESALKNLEQIPFFGLADDSLGTQKLLQATFGFRLNRPLDILSSIHYSQPADFNIEATLLRSIRVANDLDVRLYQHAYTLFQTQLSEIRNMNSMGERRGGDGEGKNQDDGLSDRYLREMDEGRDNDKGNDNSDDEMHSKEEDDMYKDDDNEIDDKDDEGSDYNRENSVDNNDGDDDDADDDDGDEEKDEYDKEIEEYFENNDRIHQKKMIIDESGLDVVDDDETRDVEDLESEEYSDDINDERFQDGGRDGEVEDENTDEKRPLTYRENQHLPDEETDTEINRNKSKTTKPTQLMDENYDSKSDTSLVDDHLGYEKNVENRGIVMKIDAKNEGIKIDARNEGIKIDAKNEGIKIDAENEGIEIDAKNEGIKIDAKNEGIKSDDAQNKNGVIDTEDVNEFFNLLKKSKEENRNQQKIENKNQQQHLVQGQPPAREQQIEVQPKDRNDVQKQIQLRHLQHRQDGHHQQQQQETYEEQRQHQLDNTVFEESNDDKFEQ